MAKDCEIEIEGGWFVVWGCLRGAQHHIMQIVSDPGKVFGEGVVGYVIIYFVGEGVFFVG